MTWLGRTTWRSRTTAGSARRGSIPQPREVLLGDELRREMHIIFDDRTHQIGECWPPTIIISTYQICQICIINISKPDQRLARAFQGFVLILKELRHEVLIVRSCTPKRNGEARNLETKNESETTETIRRRPGNSIAKAVSPKEDTQPFQEPVADGPNGSRSNRTITGLISGSGLKAGMSQQVESFSKTPQTLQNLEEAACATA